LNAVVVRQKYMRHDCFDLTSSPRGKSVGRGLQAAGSGCCAARHFPPSTGAAAEPSFPERPARWKAAGSPAQILPRLLPYAAVSPVLRKAFPVVQGSTQCRIMGLR
jgi:hypothetical protein